MELTKNFLEKDYYAAFREYECIIDCLDLLEKAFDNSDYKKAIEISEDITRSLKELNRLQERKKEIDRAKQLIIEFNVDLTLIERLRDKWT